MPTLGRRYNILSQAIAFLTVSLENAKQTKSRQ